MLNWLKDDRNRALAGWLGGGAAAVIGALWTAYLHFYAAPDAKPAAGKAVEADCGSVAINGDVTGATITAGARGGCPGAGKTDR